MEYEDLPEEMREMIDGLPANLRAKALRKLRQYGSMDDLPTYSQETLQDALATLVAYGGCTSDLGTFIADVGMIVGRMLAVTIASGRDDLPMVQAVLVAACTGIMTAACLSMEADEVTPLLESFQNAIERMALPEQGREIFGNLVRDYEEVFLQDATASFLDSLPITDENDER